MGLTVSLAFDDSGFCGEGFVPWNIACQEMQGLRQHNEAVKRNVWSKVEDVIVQ